MSDKNNFLRSLLAIGFLFFLLGILFILVLPAKKVEGFVSIFFLFLVILSTFIIYVSILSKNSLFLYLGLNLLVFSIGASVIKFNLFEIHLRKLWPIMLMSAGISLIPASYLKLKKLKTVYIIPASFLCVLGMIFMLFTFKIIKISLGTFFRFACPIIFIMAGIFLISYYFYSQSSKSNLLDNDDDEIPDLEKDENL